MAFNQFYPGYYQQQPQQIQNSGFVSVRSIEEAFNWPVAPGNSITFKDENQPFVYTKTKGFSPLEQPVFERYRLVKVEEPQKPLEQPAEAFDAREQINMLWKEVKALKEAQNDKHDNAVQTVHAESESIPSTDGRAAKPAK